MRGGTYLGIQETVKEEDEEALEGREGRVRPSRGHGCSCRFPAPQAPHFGGAQPVVGEPGGKGILDPRSWDLEAGSRWDQGWEAVLGTGDAPDRLPLGEGWGWQAARPEAPGAHLQGVEDGKRVLEDHRLAVDSQHSEDPGGAQDGQQHGHCLRCQPGERG